MPEIGSISAYPLGREPRIAPAAGRDPSGALGTSAGLGETKSKGSPSAPAEGPAVASGRQALTEDEQREVDELQRRDREVRRHEQAHVAAAGRYANSGPQYEFTTGPDGRRYATGGHVNIDTGPAETPEATLVKAQVIRRAALAPADPSAQDRAVARAANELERDARRQIREARVAESEEGEGPGSSPRAPGDEYSTDGGGIRVERLDLRA